MVTCDDMKDSDLQSSMSWVTPPAEGDAVLTFLSAAVRALGGRSDAALARTMHVQPHLIANWRRRMTIPDEHVVWFRTTFVEKVGTFNNDLPQVSLEARAAVVLLVAETDGDPIDAGNSASIAAGLALGGLLALAQFLVDVGAGWETEKLVQIMRPLMMTFRRADYLRASIA